MTAASPRPPRIAAIDIARGGALAAMFVYHFTWDAHDLGLTAIDPSSGGWSVFSHGIASSFLFLAGLSLALAQRQAKPLRAVLWRLGVLAAAAALVSLATWFIEPDRFIRFGILHCILAASLIALPLLRLPPAALALAAIAALLAPEIGRAHV